MLTTHNLLVPRLRKSRSYTSCHPDAPLWSVTGPLLRSKIEGRCRGSPVCGRAGRVGGQVGHMARIRKAYKILVGKPQGKENRRPTCKRNDNKKMDLKELRFEDVDRIQLAHHRYQGLCSTELFKRPLPSSVSLKRLLPVTRTSL
jgi:hypothetical protein